MDVSTIPEAKKCVLRNLIAERRAAHKKTILCVASSDEAAILRDILHLANSAVCVESSEESITSMDVWRFSSFDTLVLEGLDVLITNQTFTYYGAWC